MEDTECPMDRYPYKLPPKIKVADIVADINTITKHIPNIMRGYQARFKVDDNIEIRRLKRSSLMNFRVTKKQMRATM